MTKDVLVSISGLHYSEDGSVQGEETEPIEVITPAVYYYKNGKHYVIFDEVVEGMPGAVKTKIKIDEAGLLEVIKTGLTNTRMSFEKGKIHVTRYDTPYGEITMGTYTKSLSTETTEDEIAVNAEYSLDVEGEKIAESSITIKISAK